MTTKTAPPNDDDKPGKGLAVPDDTTPAENGGVTLAIGETDAEWEGVDDGDLVDPSLALSGMSVPFMELNRKPDGGFVHPETGEKCEVITAIWLARQFSRAQWDDPFNAKTAGEPACRSFDGLVPDPKSPAVKSDVCATCPKNSWDLSGAEQTTRCHQSVEAMMFVLDVDHEGNVFGDGGIFTRLRFGGIAVSPANRFWDSFKLRKPKVPPCSAIVRITLEPVDTDNGKFLRPRFEKLHTLSRAEMAAIIAERDLRIEAWRADIARDVTNAERGGDDDAKVGANQGGGPGSYIDPDDPLSEPF